MTTLRHPSAPPRAASLVWDLLRGHLLCFSRPEHGPLPNRLIVRAALAVAAIECVVRPFVRRALPSDSEPGPWNLVLLLLLWALLVMTHLLIGLRPNGIGLDRWRHWSRDARAYFLQVVVLALGVFGIMHAGGVRALLESSNAIELLAFAVLPNLLWGFWQEWIYRGLLQSALVSRWGSVAGVLIANVAFTFGPLHAYHFFTPGQTIEQHTLMFGSIFLVGLFFGIVFHRSRNLVIVGVFHGIGNAFMQGLPAPD